MRRAWKPWVTSPTFDSRKPIRSRRARSVFAWWKYCNFIWDSIQLKQEPYLLYISSRSKFNSSAFTIECNWWYLTLSIIDVGNIVWTEITFSHKRTLPLNIINKCSVKHQNMKNCAMLFQKVPKIIWEHWKWAYILFYLTIWSFYSLGSSESI